MATGKDQYRKTEGEPGIPARDNWWHSLRNLRTFSSFGNSVYRLYYGGMVGQWAIGGFASVLVLMSTLAMIFIPRIRNLD